MNNYPSELCNLCKNRENSSERKLIHAVKCNFKCINTHCACNSEVPGTCRAEGFSVAYKYMRLIQQHIAELVVRESGFLYAGEQIERTLRPHKTEIRNIFNAVCCIKDTVAVCGDVFFAYLAAHRECMDRGALRYRGRGLDERAVNIVHDFQQLGFSDDNADAPAGHKEVL